MCEEGNTTVGRNSNCGFSYDQPLSFGIPDGKLQQCVVLDVHSICGITKNSRTRKIESLATLPCPAVHGLEGTAPCTTPICYLQH